MPMASSRRVSDKLDRIEAGNLTAEEAQQLADLQAMLN